MRGDWGRRAAWREHWQKRLARGHRLPMFWRVYLHGLVLLVLVLATLGTLVYLFSVRSLGGDMHQRVAELLALPGAAEAGSEPGSVPGPGRSSPVDTDSLSPTSPVSQLSLAARAELAARLLGMRLSVYRLNDGQLLASGGEGLPPLSADEVARLRRAGTLWRGGHQWVHAQVLPGEAGGQAYVVMRYQARAEPPWRRPVVRGALILSAVLLVLALGSIPQARAIVRPLERLTEVVRAFGRGDLSARARMPCAGEVGVLAGAFDDMADRLELLIRHEKELLANVSHELRTPLARIKVALELAAEGDTVEAQRYLAEIGTDLDELSRLVEDVLISARLDLAASRAGAGQPPLRVEPVDLGSLLAQAAGRFRRAWLEVPLRVEVEGELPVLSVDPTLLRRVVDNLLDNAARHGEGRGVALGAKAGEKELEVWVRDRGPGISPEDLPQLFEPFFRTDRSRDRVTGGVGLGLTLARRVVEAHGGTIWAESTKGEGTSLRFRLPMPGMAEEPVGS